jgi:hypothetical protein
LVACGLVEEPDVERLLGFAGEKRLRYQKLKPLSHRHGGDGRYQEPLTAICRFAVERSRRATGMRHGLTSTSVADADAPNASRKSEALEALLAARKMERLSSRSTFSNQQQIIT